MDIFGIGNMELVVILLVALLVLGPVRMVEMARMLGRFWREARRTIRYTIDAASLDEKKGAPRPIVDAREDMHQEAAAKPPSTGTATGTATPQPPEAGNDGEGR